MINSMEVCGRDVEMLTHPQPIGGPQPNPLGRWAPTAKSLLIETLDDGSPSFTNLMYWLDLGEFPKTTMFERWKEHFPKT